MKKSKLFLLALPALLLAGCNDGKDDEEPNVPFEIQWSDISREEMATAITNHLTSFELKLEDDHITSKGDSDEPFLNKMTSKFTTIEYEEEKDEYSLMGNDPVVSNSKDSEENQYNMETGYHYKRTTNDDDYEEIHEQYTGEKHKEYSFNQDGIVHDNVITDDTTTAAEAYKSGQPSIINSAVRTSIRTLSCVVDNKLKVEDDPFGTIPSMVKEFVADASFTYKYQKSNHGLYRVTQSYMATSGAAAADSFTIPGVGTATSITGTINCKYVHVIEFGGNNLLNLETITNGNENEKATMSLSGTGHIMSDGDALTYDAEYLKRNLVVTGFTADVRNFQ